MKPTPKPVLKPTPISSRRLARARERAAAAGAPLLATVLQQYCEREKLNWAELAARLGGDENALDAVALCSPPREESFVEDTRAIAEGYLDWQQLLLLLRELQVLSAFAAPDASDAILLAARDYDETESSDEFKSSSEIQTSQDEAQE